MNVIAFTAKNGVTYKDLPEPKAGLYEVTVPVKARGGCHIDYEILKDNYGTEGFPVMPRHEYAEAVVAVGLDVLKVEAGDHVVIESNIKCGTCRHRVHGSAHLREKLDA